MRPPGNPLGDDARISSGESGAVTSGLASRKLSDGPAVFRSVHLFDFHDCVCI